MTFYISGYAYKSLFRRTNSDCVKALLAAYLRKDMKSEDKHFPAYERAAKAGDFIYYGIRDEIAGVSACLGGVFPWIYRTISGLRAAR